MQFARLLKIFEEAEYCEKDNKKEFMEYKNEINFRM